ncbi:MAG: hypothetical protein P8Z35_12950 [Ignavibacteriaceae bacterium]
MNIILDLLGSSVIGGMILLMVLQMNLFMSNARFSSDSDLQVQQNAKTLAEIINHDFRKIGYQHSGTSILVAEKEKIKFVGDLQRPGESGYGTLDTVEYCIKDSTFATGTSNPRDIILVRVLNNKDSIDGPSLGLVKINFNYLDSVSMPTADLSKIKFIKTELWLQPTETVHNYLTGIKDTTFTYWEFTINPRNI